jgi:hypothetical protein
VQRHAKTAKAGTHRGRSGVRAVLLASIVTGLAGAAAAAYLLSEGLFGPDDAALPRLSYAELTGSVFLPAPADPFRAPAVRELQLPEIPGGTSVWGATGRDARGRIWVGVSTRSSGNDAHLLQYDPDRDVWHDRGAVVERLKAAGLHRPEESQTKIHSKIVPGDDGWLYFASSSEAGESPGVSPPRWGGHIWRIDPDRFEWRHVAAVPEGLVAMAGGGRYVLALGYWDHVLYRIDTSDGDLRQVTVGSVGGHVSRNLLADARGHAYVPRVQAASNGSLEAALVEYDSELRPVGETPLEFYLGKGNPNPNHGIVGLAYLPDGRLLFTTHRGHLYAIEPQPGAAAKVSALGWFDPGGEAYAPSLFAVGGNRLVAGVTRREGRFEWVAFELTTRVSAAFALDTKQLQRLQLYGSISRDNAGRAYVGGWAAGEKGTGQRPVVLQISQAN